MNNISLAYIHHAPESVKQAAIKQAVKNPFYYEDATEEGRVPAALMLAALGGGLGAGGASLLSKKNKGRNALIAGLLGAAAGGAGGYYGAGLPTGLARGGSLDPTSYQSLGTGDDSLTLGQAMLGLSNKAQEGFGDLAKYIGLSE